MTIGEKIKKIREELKKSKIEFAKENSVAPAYITLVEAGEIEDISVDFIYNIVKKYEINPEWLVYDRGEILSNNEKYRVYDETADYDAYYEEKVKELKKIQEHLEILLNQLVENEKNKNKNK